MTHNTVKTQRNVLVRINGLHDNGYAFANRLDTGEGVFIPQSLADRVDAQPEVIVTCAIVPAKAGAATAWRAVHVKPAKERLQPICTSSDDHVVDDRILVILQATGRAVTAEAMAEVLFGRGGVRDFYATCVNRAQERLDYLHEMNQVLCATVFRATTPEGEEAEVYGLPEVFGGVVL